MPTQWMTMKVGVLTFVCTLLCVLSFLYVSFLVYTFFRLFLFSPIVIFEPKSNFILRVISSLAYSLNNQSFMFHIGSFNSLRIHFQTSSHPHCLHLLHRLFPLHFLSHLLTFAFLTHTFASFFLLPFSFFSFFSFYHLFFLFSLFIIFFFLFSTSFFFVFSSLPLATFFSFFLHFPTDGLIDCEDSDCCISRECQEHPFCISGASPEDIRLRSMKFPDTDSFYDRVKFLIEENSVQVVTFDTSPRSSPVFVPSLVFDFPIFFYVY